MAGSHRLFAGLARLIAGTLVVLAASVLASAPALAQERRIALIIGNSGYEGGVLANPVHDARLVGRKLEEVGFEVTVVTDANENEMERAIVDFMVALQAAGRDAVGLFYFAGHGIQSSGENYLIPVGNHIERRADLGVEAVRLNWVAEQLQDVGNRINFIVLDACRNNPLPRSIFRSAGEGLATLDAPVGTFIAYSTAPGTVAADGDGTNSPYAAAFAENIELPNVPAEMFFKRVRDTVRVTTNGLQVPWDSSSLVGDDFFFVSRTETITTGPDGGVMSQTTTISSTTSTGPAQEHDPFELSFWESIRDSNDPADFEAYLEQYPEGAFAALARNRLAANTSSASRPTPSAAGLPAPTYVVDAAGGGDFLTISEAVAAASDGDVIHVRPGVYAEDVSFEEDEHVTLIGLTENGERPRIVAGEVRPLYVAGGEPVIENFILEGDKDEYATVWAPGGRPTLRNNAIRASVNSCVWVEGYAAPTLENNEIGPCGAYGIKVVENGGGSFELNTFAQIGFSAISAIDSSTASFIDNTIGRTGETAIWVDGEASPVIEHNVVEPGESRGMEVFGFSAPTVRGNTFRGGLRGIVVGGDAFGLFENNDVSGTQEQGVLVYERASPSVVDNILHDLPTNCIHVTDSATGHYENNHLFGCGTQSDEETYSAVSIGPHAAPTLTGNLIESPGYADIFNENVKLDVSGNDIRP